MAYLFRRSFFRFYGTKYGFDNELKEIIKEQLPKQKKRIEDFRNRYGTKKMSDVTVNMLYGGMRGMEGLFWETSTYCQDKGIRFRDLTIDECETLLPRYSDGRQPIPEAMFWFLLTGDLPSSDQVKILTKEWAIRSSIPEYLIDMLAKCPYHPMTQLSAAMTVLNHDSHFAKAYARGVPKSSRWEYVFEDSMNITAKLPGLAATIYRNLYKGSGLGIRSVDPYRDWSYNFAAMLGYLDKQFMEFLRLYLTIHADWTGGNVTSHTSLLVGSALADPYLAYSSGLAGLGGTSITLALLWLDRLTVTLGDDPSEGELEKYIDTELKEGRAIPSYNHVDIKGTDPRYTSLKNYAKKYLPDDKAFKLVLKLEECVPKIMMKYRKIENPWPNVEAISGVLMRHYGIQELPFYNVIFGVARSMGVMTNQIWARALELPMERPRSISTDLVEELAQQWIRKAR